MSINEKLSKIQAELKAKKSKFNSFGKYNYRSAEDILEAIKPFLLEHNVTVTINEDVEELGGMIIMNSVARISDGKDFIEAVAVVAVDMDQKGMNAPQKFGSASSYAKKYALGNLLLIDDTADPDATNTHGKSAKPKLEGIALTKAKEFIKNGGSKEAIKAKYDIPADIEATL
jgi:hypothetical protein